LETRVTVRIEDSEMAKIEQRIKQDYPKIKTVSGLVRAALDEFLGTENKQDKVGF
jgi:Arc/MetJ-type ribon-helix-helix transcriptional regulator